MACLCTNDKCYNGGQDERRRREGRLIIKTSKPTLDHSQSGVFFVFRALFSSTPCPSEFAELVMTEPRFCKVRKERERERIKEKTDEVHERERSKKLTFRSFSALIQSLTILIITPDLLLT